MSDEKDNAVTISKGIAIILMVIGHSSCPGIMEKYIVLFHMPLFFFFSGYCFKSKYLQDRKQFIKRRIEKLWIPFVKWGLIFLFLHNIFYELNIYNDIYGYRGNVSHIYTIQEFLKRALLIITTMRAHEQLLGGYWFLHDLFFASLLSLIILKLNVNRIVLVSFALLFSLVCSITQFKIPYFDIGYRQFMAVSFFLAGSYFKEYDLTKKYANKKILLYVLLFVFLLFGPAVFHASMMVIEPFQIIPYFFIAIVGTHIVYSFSSMLSNSRLLKVGCFIGDNTLTILTWHFIVMRMVSLFVIMYYGIPIVHLSHHPVIEEYAEQGWWIVYSVIGIGVPCVLAYINKYKFFSWINF